MMVFRGFVSKYLVVIKDMESVIKIFLVFFIGEFDGVYFIDGVFGCIDYFNFFVGYLVW